MHAGGKISNRCASGAGYQVGQVGNSRYLSEMTGDWGGG